MADEKKSLWMKGKWWRGSSLIEELISSAELVLCLILYNLENKINLFKRSILNDHEKSPSHHSIDRVKGLIEEPRQDGMHREIRRPELCKQCSAPCIAILAAWWSLSSSLDRLNWCELN